MTRGQVQRRIETLQLQCFSTRKKLSQVEDGGVSPRIHLMENRFEALRSALAIVQAKII
ncbi:hypothetical protein [Kamptonema sp. UHCC 0994]|uniref:hypothetical protein n=1 Tax=Kamptonema sp. UHCC 0994 TaxID=3031329 RepID=UPI0023BA6C6E|nr:hypothetical protein [Kamptonema sp. UHCC 0994]MDF0556535.1 hypothetical protein [Kamptonema sp. UHCC 0994]